MIEVTGIGPYIKRGTFKMFVEGTGFNLRDDVTIQIPRGAMIDSRSGTVVALGSGGCVVRVGPRVTTTPKEDIIDDDLVDVTVTVTNGTETSNDYTEPGIAE